MTATVSPDADDPPLGEGRDFLEEAIQRHLDFEVSMGRDLQAARRDLALWVFTRGATPEFIAAELQHLLNRKILEAKGAGPVLVSLETVKPEKVEWLVEGWIPLGKTTLLSGDPKLGKSVLGLSFAAAASTGACWPNKNGTPTKKGSVIILSAEDGVEDTIVPRLEAMGADRSRIKVLQAVRDSKDENTPVEERPFCLEDDIRHLDMAIEQLGDAVLVIIDPVTAYGSRTDGNSNHEVRRLLTPLAALAARHKVAVICVNHLNKNAAGPAIYRSMGSLAYTATARMLITVAKDRKNPERRLVLRDGNLTKSGASGLAYMITGDPVTDAAMLAWETDPVTITADEALAAPEREKRGDGELARAEEFLRSALADGPVASEELREDARQNGISERTQRRAEETLEVRSKKVGKKWFKHLPDDDGQVGQPPGPAGMATLAALKGGGDPEEESHTSSSFDGDEDGQGGQPGKAAKSEAENPVEAPREASPGPSERDDGQGGQGGQQGQPGNTATSKDPDPVGEAGVGSKPLEVEGGQGGQDGQGGQAPGAASFMSATPAPRPDPEGGQDGLFPEGPAWHDDGSEVGSRG
jgi:archaellum biogenesis ATPase FlaH